MNCHHRSDDHEERGAIGVMGAFLAPFLVAAVYYLVGLGTAALQREGLQQAADVSAFAAAVASARSMNMIVVLNVLMASVMAIMVPVRALMLAYPYVVATTPCGPDTPCECSIKRDAARAYEALTPRALAAEQRAAQLLAALSDAEDAIARTGPRLAGVAASNAAKRDGAALASPSAMLYSSSLSAGSSDGGSCRLGLPVEDDSFGQACRRPRRHFDRIARRIAGPEMLDTFGECKSGDRAMAYATTLFATPESPVLCKEASSPPCSGGPHPKKVIARAKNGTDDMQLWTEVQGRKFDTESRRGVESGSYEVKGKAPLDALNIGFAQAELFFDCAGGWKTTACNAEEGAMWNTRWTARLRRVHAPSISFAGDERVQTLTDPEGWRTIRQQLMRERAGALGSAEGALQ
jgi:hypothetical protein